MKLAIIGPSGCGKTTIINAYIAKYGDFSVMLNCTTRSKRGENDNEFTFISREEFEDLINSDFFFEYEYIFNNYYGTPRDNLTHKDVFFNVDINGAIKLQNEIKNLVIVFILAPSREELIARLHNRRCNSNIEKRLQRINEEVTKHHVSNYKIINESIDESVRMLRNIIEIERMREKFDSIIVNF